MSSNNTTAKKLTLKILEARIQELESRIQELEANKGKRTSSKKDTGVSLVREVTPQVVSYKLTTFVGKAVYALGYHMKDALATYTYNAGIMRVSPEEQDRFEAELRDFFSGDEEKGYKAREVTIEDGDIREAIKAMKANKAA